MVTSPLRSKYLTDCMSWLRVCSKSQLQSYTAHQQSQAVTLCSACRHNLHMYVQPTRLCTTYTCMYNLHVYVLPTRVCTTYTCMYYLHVYVLPTRVCTACHPLQPLTLKISPSNSFPSMLWRSFSKGLSFSRSTSYSSGEPPTDVTTLLASYQGQEWSYTHYTTVYPLTGTISIAC